MGDHNEHMKQIIHEEIQKAEHILQARKDDVDSANTRIQRAKDAIENGSVIEQLEAYHDLQSFNICHAVWI